MTDFPTLFYKSTSETPTLLMNMNPEENTPLGIKKSPLLM